MNLTEKHALEAADARAFCKWEDGEGEQCATTSGVWFAAIAYERARVAALKEEASKEDIKALKWLLFIFLGAWIAVGIEAWLINR